MLLQSLLLTVTRSTFLAMSTAPPSAWIAPQPATVTGVLAYLVLSRDRQAYWIMFDSLITSSMYMMAKSLSHGFFL